MVAAFFVVNCVIYFIGTIGGVFARPGSSLNQLASSYSRTSDEVWRQGETVYRRRRKAAEDKPDRSSSFWEPYSMSVTQDTDGSTGKKVTSVRCGYPDGQTPANDSEARTDGLVPMAYKLSGRKWDKRRLTWGVTLYSKKTSEEIQLNSIKAAFLKWQEVANLKFVYITSGTPDIEIRFVSGDHGDNHPFDGPGIVLAHAFPPGDAGIAGDMHFDEAENWGSDISEEGDKDFFLMHVAMHELGHALGLEHSRVKNSIMYAVMDPEQLTLANDDIAAVQALYGADAAWKNRPEIISLIANPEDTQCPRLYSAIFLGPEGDVFGVLVNTMYTLNGFNLKFPKALQDVYPRAPIEVDFAVSVSKGQVTYMFRGTAVWKFSGYKLDKGYPRAFNIREMPEMPLGASSTFRNGKEVILMFGSQKVWTWDMQASGVQNVQEMQDISALRAEKYDLITSWTDGFIYLISSKKHMKIDENFKRISGYPKDGVPDWLQIYCIRPNRSSTISMSSYLLAAVLMIPIFRSIRSTAG